MEQDSNLMTLQSFFADECFGRSHATCDRYERVYLHLLRYFDEADVSFCLGTDPATLLEVERQFDGDGAFLRVFGFAEVICCMPEFLSDSWLLAVPADARTQISLVNRLVHWLSRHRLYDRREIGCAFFDVEAAIKQARQRLRGSSASIDDPWDPATRLRLALEEDSA